MADAPRRLVTADKRPEDEPAIRPQRLADFAGQEAARKNLGIFIQSARSRGDALDHVLFVGPPGLGKTTLAQIVARELGVNFRSTSGPVIVKAGDLRRSSPISNRATSCSSTKSIASIRRSKRFCIRRWRTSSSIS